MSFRLALILALLPMSAVTVPGAALAQLDARDMEICRQECMARARDASDPRYRSCVRSRCNGEPVRRTTAPRRNAAPKAAAPAAAAAVALGSWAVADHPALGNILMTQAEQGALGLGCTATGAEIRATNGLFGGAALGWITDTGSAGGTIPLSPGAAFSQAAGDACNPGIAGLASAGALVLVTAPVTSRGRGQGYSGALPGGEIRVLSGAELQLRVPGVRVLPVPGLAAGITALGASCPAVALALRTPCP